MADIFDETQGSIDPFAATQAEPTAPAGGIRSRLLDTGIDLAKGAVDLGQSVVGIADLASRNVVGQGLRAVGYDPAKTNAILSEGYSDARKQANTNVEQAKGFIPTVKALWDNPSAAVGAIAESAPSSLGMAGGIRTVGAKMLASALAKEGIAAGTAEAAVFASKFFSNPRTVAALTGVGGAVEGAQTAGSIQEQAADAGKPWKESAGPSLAAGLGTGAISMLSSQIPGLKDAEVALATSGMRGLRSGKGLVETGKEIAKTMFKEGVLEEMPQSAQEQAFTNIALGKPWQEGVGEAAATGLVVGAGQGGGMSAAAAGIDATVKQSKEKDSVQAALLNKLTPEGTTVTVDGGEATVTKQTNSGTTTMKVPVAEAAKVMAAGGKVEDVATPVDPKKTKINRLPDDPSLPNALVFNVKGKEYAYAPKERMSRDELIAGLEGKSPGMAFNWLKKNSVQVKLEDANATDQQVPAPQVQPIEEGVNASTTEPQAPPALAASPQEIEQQILNEEINNAINIPSPPGVGDVPAAVTRDIGEGAADAQVPGPAPDTTAGYDQTDAGPTELVGAAAPSSDVVPPVETPSASVKPPKAPKSLTVPGSKTPKVPKAYVKLATDIATVIKEDGVSDDFKRVPSFEAIAAYREKYPDDSPNTAMSEMAWMPDAEYQALTEVADEEVLFSRAEGTTFEESKNGKLIGYKVMAVNDDGSLRSGANSRLSFPAKVGGEIAMVGDGVFVSNNPEYVIEYYSGLADNEVLLKVEFDKKDIVFGESQLADKEPEIGLSKVTILEVSNVEDPLLSQTQATGTTTQQVEQELKDFLGNGFGNLVRQGKLEVVQGVERLPKNIRSFLKMVAWHGTPHEVDKFSSSKIGTGEGAQSYGYGLYFAGSKDVATWYRNKLSKLSVKVSGEEVKSPIVRAALDKSGGDFSKAIDWCYAEANKQSHISLAEDYYDAAEKLVEYKKLRKKAIISKPGKLYQVELAPSEDEYLLWDRPLSEQSETVKAALKTLYKNEKSSPDRSTYLHPPQKGKTGWGIYNDMSTVVKGGEKATSELLHKYGIRGIKYLDGTSRNRPLKDIKKAFLNELPEDATFEDVTELVGTGRFSAEQDRVITALNQDDWLGFDYPAQAISAVLSRDLANYDASPELIAAVSELSKDATYNYVIFNDEDINITAIFSKNGDIAGAYDTKNKKVYLVANNIKPEDARYVMLHEGTHALLREDKVFVKQKEQILSDFEALAASDDSVRAAFARVPANTPSEIKVEEGLAYWLQNKDNHQHSIFKRVISAIKAALYRLGIAPGRLTASDMSALFTQGTQAWARQEVAAPEVTDPALLFSRIDDTLKAGQKKLDTAVQALKNPRSFLHEKYLEYAPQWLSVTPLHTLAQTFGKTIPQIRQFAKHLDAVVASKTEIVDTSAVLYEQAEKLAEAGVGLDVFNTAAATASFNRITPWADLYEQAWVPETGTKSDRLKSAQKAWVAAKMQQATGKSYIEAYSQARQAYAALKTEDLKQAYIKVVEHIASVRIRERNNLLAYIESVSEKGTELRANLMAQFEASFSNLHGAYWPLSRVGDFRMEYTDTEGFRTVKHYTTLAERREDKAAILAEGVDPDTIKEDYKDKQPRGSVAIPQMLMGQLAEAVEKKVLTGVDLDNEEAVTTAQERAQAITDDMNQIWLRWQPETSALKNSVRRKNVKGFSKEMLRSYLDYMQRHASNIAWTEQGKKIEQDIKSLSDDILEKKAEDGMVDVTMQRHILNDLRNRIQALRSVSVGPVASVLGKLGTAYYMTSPSIALVQMSQLGVLTLPKLSTMFGAGKASTALAKGTRDAFKKDYTRSPMFADPVVNTVYKNMREVVTDENRTVPQAVGKELGERLFTDQQILNQMKSFTPYQIQLLTLREAMARNLLDISAAHEAYELTRGKDPKSLWNRAFKFAMLPMSLSELASRKATVLATLELSQQKGQDFFGSMNTISEVVNDTLYSYSKENKGSAMQGGLSRVVLQFQHYRIMTGIRLAMLFRNAVKGESAEVKQAATKELVGVMGMSAALAGTMGLPLSGLVFAIMNLLLGDDDEPIDSELMYTNWLRETLGETLGDVAASGLPTLAGANLSGRIGLSGIYGIQNEPPTGLHGRDLAAWWAASQLGPIFSVGQGWFQGYDEIVNKGNYLKGLEAAAPKPLKDGFKAYRVATEGLKNGQGKRLLADEAIGPDEIVLVALGFNADEIAKAQSAERSLNKLSTKISERRGQLIKQAAQAFVEGDDASPALERIRNFNRSMPRFGINGGDIRPAIRKILVGDLGTTGPRESLVVEQYEVPVYSSK